MDQRERAKKIVDDIVNDLTKRRGLRQEFEGIDKAIRAEILESWCDIVAATIEATDATPLEQTGTFAWAVKQQRPMRRAAWLKHAPVSAKNEDVFRMIIENSWVFLRVLVESPTEARWLWITTGKPMSLVQADYVGTDWEVL